MRPKRKNAPQPYKKPLRKFLDKNLGKGWMQQLADDLDLHYTTVNRYFNTATLNAEVETAAFALKKEVEQELAAKLEAAS